MTQDYQKTLPLTQNGDVLVDEQDRINLRGGEEAVVHELKILIQTIQGEDPFDRSHGLRLFEVTGSSDAVLERELRFVLLSDNRVDSVVDVTVAGPEESEEVGLGNRGRAVSVTVELVEAGLVSFEVGLNE